jgi:hypothetical protein
MSLRGLLRCVALVLVASPIAPAAAGPKVVFVDCDGAATAASVRPRTIVLACGDGNAQLIKLHWSTWGGTTATGRGTAVLNDCTPTCVGGTFRRYPMRVSLSAIKPCRDLRQYTRLRIVYSCNPFPPGSRRVDDRRGCAHPA